MWGRQDLSLNFSSVLQCHACEHIGEVIWQRRSHLADGIEAASQPTSDEEDARAQCLWRQNRSSRDKREEEAGQIQGFREMWYCYQLRRWREGTVSWGVCVASRSWEWSSADSQRRNGAPREPMTPGADFCQHPEWAWKWICPWSAQKGTQPCNTLILTGDTCTDPNLQSCKMIDSC